MTTVRILRHDGRLEWAGDADAVFLQVGEQERRYVVVGLSGQASFQHRKGDKLQIGGVGVDPHTLPRWAPAAEGEGVDAGD